MNETIPSCEHWRVERDSDDILWLFLNRKGEAVNSLSAEVLLELDALIGHTERRTPSGLAILSDKTTGFILGADIRQFGTFTEAEAVTRSIQQVHDIFSRLEKLPCPTVAAFEGYCLGGGLELALSCNYRIVRDLPATKIGFPEIQLGIFPGFGGSARSITRIGGLKAMELMLSARQINARQAQALGLVDEVIGRHEELFWAARRAITGRRKSRSPSFLARLTNTNPARHLLAKQMRKQTALRAREEHYPAPYWLIDTWEQYGGDRNAMMKAEALAVGRLMVTPQAAGLRRVFGLMERLKKEGKQSDFRARRVHVIGAGVMGGDIAAWCVLQGLEVSLQDREMKFIESAMKRAEALFKKKRLEPAAVKAAMDRLRPDVDGDLVPQADVVIEVIIERLDAKQALLGSLEPRLKPGAVLATNTSSIPLEELATALKEPGRLIGLHFFNPVAKMPLVEVVQGAQSDPEMLRRGAAFCGQINRYPLPVKSSPGFLVNRVLAPYMMEAMIIHQEGVPIEAIDAAAEAFGMPMGPVELADTVGLDVCLMVTKTLAHRAESSANPAMDKATAQLKHLTEQGHLGRKSGQGFYRWEKDKPSKNKEKIAGHDLAAIGARLIKTYTDECQAALADGIVADADLLDAGMVFGTGFAPFRGGPLHYLKTQTLKSEVPSNQPSVEDPNTIAREN
ncbi:MAG: 3-hydroxyacyl-CoA dehydrogenase NAD-binding domain-containing protein [Gammaproteobacteria bacterium]|nr:3-hydroxyacyl-CoA dehydrogenase NAD-binding domain-containing protein [Gammaproteobacteria bacterium]MDP2348370.1 3-hydroxyacyl-CoA dehydrogenase NAD-binding domain-containing protein [Gammaproteobacteria bacterium]